MNMVGELFQLGVRRKAGRHLGQTKPATKDASNERVSLCSVKDNTEIEVELRVGAR